MKKLFYNLIFLSVLFSCDGIHNNAGRVQFEISSSSINFNKDGGSDTILITANYEWEARSSEKWCSLSSYNGNSGQSYVTVSALPNDTYETRIATLHFYVCDELLTASVVQSDNIGLFISAKSYEVSHDSTYLDVQVFSNVNFKVDSISDWLHIIKTKSLSESVISIFVEENLSPSDRLGEVIISDIDNNYSDTLLITQYPDPLLFKNYNQRVVHAYDLLGHSYWYGGYYVLDSEMKSDNAIRPIPDFQSGRMWDSYNLSYTPQSQSPSMLFWNVAYREISIVNDIIEDMESTTDSESISSLGGYTQSDLNNLKAECLFLRAISYFDLLRQFSHFSVTSYAEYGVPIIRSDTEEMPARSNVREVFDYIIDDLLEAESIISADYVRGDVPDRKSAVSLEAVQALLSRVYLYSEEYQKSAEYATKVINSAKFTLWNVYDYPYVWTLDIPIGGEIIFEVYGSSNNPYDPYWEGCNCLTDPNVYGDCAVSPALIDLFEDGDVRGTKGIREYDDGLVMFGTDINQQSGGQLWTTKYSGKNRRVPDYTNVVILRLSEMYLNRAEALAKGAVVSGASALEDVNIIRQNRGLQVLESVTLEQILRERRLELCFEGHYWYDIARTDRYIEYCSSDRSVSRLSEDSYQWALPIMQSTIDNNQQIMQNYGY